MTTAAVAYRKCLLDLRIATRHLGHALAYAPHETLRDLLLISGQLQRMAEEVEVLADPERTMTLPRVTP